MFSLFYVTVWPHCSDIIIITQQFASDLNICRVLLGVNSTGRVPELLHQIKPTGDVG